MMDATERRAFVRENNTCVVGYTRQKGPPSMSIVYYVMDGDDIVFSTMRDRQKAKAVEREGELSIAVLDGQWPPTYLVVYGDATVEADEEKTVDVAMKIGAVMSGSPIPAEARPIVQEMCEKEGRIVVRGKPNRTFYSPPVHLNKSKDAVDPEKQKKMKHGLGASHPW
jgi:PPOX class probable F420-dependent enzyme